MWWIGEGGAERRGVEDINDLVLRTDGWVWVDIPTLDTATEQLLAAVFDFHPRDGPLNPVVSLETALRQTGEAARRLESGRLRPASPYALSCAIVSSIVRYEEELTGTLARDVGLLEQQVMAGAEEDPEDFLVSCSRPGTNS